MTEFWKFATKFEIEKTQKWILKICHQIYEFATQIINLPQIYWGLKNDGRLKAEEDC